MQCPKHPNNKHFVAVEDNAYVFCYSCLADAVIRLGVPNLSNIQELPLAPVKSDKKRK